MVQMSVKGGHEGRAGGGDEVGGSEAGAVSSPASLRSAGAGAVKSKGMSKAERKKAKRRSERRGSTDDDLDQASLTPSLAASSAACTAATAVVVSAGSESKTERTGGNSSASQHTQAVIVLGSSGEGDGGGNRRVEMELEALPLVCLGAGEEAEDVESDEEMAGPAPLREIDIDWASGPDGGEGAGDSKPSMVFEIAKGQVSSGRLDHYLSGFSLSVTSCVFMCGVCVCVYVFVCV